MNTITVKRAFQYRLSPSKGQTVKLTWTLDRCRELYILTNKAEEAGSVVVAVNPAGTSQHCSSCGAKVPKALSERRHECAACGLSLQRDVNAARNILHRAGLARAVV